MKGWYFFAASVVAFIVGVAWYGTTGSDGGIFLVMIGMLVLPLFGIGFGARNMKKKLNEPERVAKRKAIQEQYAAEAAERRRKRVEAQRIVEVKMLGPGATSQKRGGLGGAVMGGLVAGPLGAVVGATIPTNGEQMQRFAVKYGDGSVKVMELHPNDWKYKELMKYVKWEDVH